MVGCCIEWTKARNRTGYGIVGSKKECSRLAHRVAWTKAFGPIPDGLNVLHKCDNPPCVNVEHLFLGTQKANIADCMQKGRLRGHRYAAGHKSYSVKLTEAQASEIRSSSDSQRNIANAYGVSQQTVSDIKRGRRWVNLGA
jgi:hypothetical protein